MPVKGNQTGGGASYSPASPNRSERRHNMLIEYTPQEAAKFEAIRLDYKQRILSLTDAIDGAAGEDRKRLINERAQLQLQLSNELEAYSEKCEAEHFKQIAGNPEAVLESAGEQIPRLIQFEYAELTAHSTPEDLKGIGIADTSGERVLLKANFMAGLLMEELKLHLAALQQDKPRLQRLFSLIIEGVEDSTLTNGEDITIDAVKKTPLEIVRYRRSPLKDINLYGLMNDKANAQLIQDSGIFQQTTNGQMRLLFDVDHTPAAVKKKAAKSGQEVPAEKQVVSYIALTYEGTEGKLTKKLTAFDNAVYNAIATRFYYWALEEPQKPLYITPQEIWRTMNGKRSGDGKANPSKAQVKRICDSIDKMRFTRFYMDIKDEVQAYNLYFEDERITGGIIDSYLVNCSKVEFTTEKGRTLTGYRIGEEPILYTYNRRKEHILYVPYEMLDTSAKTSDSENVTEFRNYLLQAVQLMKNGAADRTGKYFKRSNRVLLSDIYQKTGIQPPEERLTGEYANENTRQQIIRRTRKADRTKVEGILDAWTAKGWIKGYKPVKKGNSLIGYDIDI